MASAREYSHLTGGVRRDVVAMIEKAVSNKRKGEGLVVHGSQCHGFIDSQLATVRETSFLDGVPQRSMTLVSLGEEGKLDLTLGASLAGLEGQAASKAAKKWGGKKAGGEERKERPRRTASSKSAAAAAAAAAGVVETQVLETERVLRARRDASVTVNVRERDGERGGRGRSAVQETPSWSSVRLTAEDIFREGGGKWWVGETDKEYVYCVVRQSCNVDKSFTEFISAVQIHIYGVMKLQGLE